MNQLASFLNDKLDGSFDKISHESYNSHYVGYSKHYNSKVFIKVFPERNRDKYITEKTIIQDYKERYIDSFEKYETRFIVLAYEELDDIVVSELENHKLLTELAKLLASYHHEHRHANLPKNTNISKKIEDTLFNLKDRANYSELLDIWKQMKKYKGTVDREYLETEKVSVHGDFGVRNIKRKNNQLQLIDFERSKLDVYFLDFIKFYYGELKNDENQKELFMNEYLKHSIVPEVSIELQYFLIFYAGLGIMKYTMDFNDKDFENMGFEMIKDTVEYFNNHR